jgi:hypothetical protein
VTWPSPAMTTFPFLRTQRMVVERTFSLIEKSIPEFLILSLFGFSADCARDHGVEISF